MVADKAAFCGPGRLQALAKQLGAQISVDNAAPGTRVSLTRTAHIARQVAANDEAEIAAV
ncbi:hypothetical protein ASE06_12825 [Sphingopyxis sp. Root214]|jgi:hypothetical protein|uniref:hypothetical protein n=1 Tax=unclassified Sphingopyxis TaxID=2614943 RepID=UPI0006F961EE|nr:MULTISPECIES: hypothetical protein [unclassified Sphingopyxis]KQZ73279.1 hypothetical protein ASD73_10475 [Sphingopyxis sp. Root154]KRC07426.1 hypothetical protein ASE06_12825 [Sphingopyxis sp. Root214]